MNITYISLSSAPSHVPSSLQIVKTCEALTSFNHKVSLIVPNTSKVKKSIFNYYAVKHKFNFYKINFIKKFPLGISFYLFIFLSIIKAKKLKTDLIITRSFFLVFICNLINLKCILELHHDIEIEGRLTKFLIKNTNFLNSKNIKKIIAISKPVKQLFSKKYKVKKDIIVLPSGSSLNVKFLITNKKKLNIGYFGSLSLSKGIKLIFELSKIDKSNNYFIYGGQKKDIEKFKIYKQKNLNFSKHVSYKLIPNLISKMDILILPYTDKIHSAGEVGDISKFTSPLKLFDYMNAGKLIIASDIKILNEVLIHNKNSILIKNFSNPFSWKHEINKIKNNFSKRFILSKRVFLQSKEFNHKKRTKKYLN